MTQPLFSNVNTGSAAKRVIKPVYAWCLACLVASVLIAGIIHADPLETSAFYLHEIDWIGIFSDQQNRRAYVEIWIWVFGFVMGLTALPVFASVWLFRRLKTPRGWTDVFVAALLPNAIIVVLLIFSDEFNELPPYQFWLNLAVIGGLCGLVYWLAAGRPQAWQNTKNIPGDMKK